jgi:hypothetical protein
MRRKLLRDEVEAVEHVEGTRHQQDPRTVRVVHQTS